MFTRKKSLLFLLLSGVLAMIASVLFFTSDPAEEGEVDAAVQPYYLNSYEDSRAAFRSLAMHWKSEGAVVESFRVPSAVDDDLTIDTLYIPPKGRPEKLVIIASGTHGIEAFTGSAVQRYFLKRILPELDRTNLGVLAVHAVNPYGFRYERRVSEHNVDLNRNWDVEPSLFQSKNEGYEIVNEMLNPKGKVDLGSMDNRFFAVRSIMQIVQHGMPALRQAILQGQYAHPQGLYFGGRTFEPQKALLEPLFKKTAASYSHVLLIDLHTGFGERGRLHLFPNAIRDPAVRARLEAVFEGYQIDYGDTEDFYTTTGDFSEYMGKLLDDKIYLPMVFEYGTMDSQTTSGSIRSLHNMIVENQGFWHGYESDDDETEAKRRFREHYNPTSHIWRTKVIHDSDALLRRSIANFLSLKD
ncbi:MAG: DUF2817 domain-containing protein [Leptonema illini]|uniref:DUF2817 domain-containing protein n=1 Tax=Leptonema illini TaxID=183 RepID=A0A833LXZ7_9LEPT|nr:MAG: DUF2817 domain-containing protein [Leptonema illini]